MFKNYGKWRKDTILDVSSKGFVQISSATYLKTTTASINNEAQCAMAASRGRILVLDAKLLQITNGYEYLTSYWGHSGNIPISYFTFDNVWKTELSTLKKNIEEEGYI